MATDSALQTISCPQCGKPAKEVVHAEARIRKGWYCTECKRFEPAILRERTVK